MKDNLVTAQMVNGSNGMRSPAFTVTLGDLADLLEKDVPVDDHDKHFVLVLIEHNKDEKGEDVVLFSNRPMIYVSRFIEYMKGEVSNG